MELRETLKHECTLPPSMDNDPFVTIPMNVWKRTYLKCAVVSERHPLHRQYIRSTGAMAFERRRHILFKHWYVLHPFSMLNAGWQILMVLVSAVIVFDAPMCHKTLYDVLFRNYNAILYLVACLNVVVLFFTGYVDDASQDIILDHGNIVRTYLKTYFLIDVLGAFPFSYFCQTFIPEDNFDDLHIRYRTNIMGLTNIFILRIFIKYSRTSLAFCGATESVITMFRLVVYSGLFLHWSASVQVCLPGIIYGMYLKDAEGSWLNRVPPFEEHKAMYYVSAESYQVANPDGSVSTRYRKHTVWGMGHTYGLCVFRAGCWIFPFGQGGLQPLTVEDMYLGVVTTILGRLFFFTLLVKVLRFRSWVRSPQVRYLMVMEQVKQFMRRKQLPPLLQRKVRVYYDYRYDRSYFRERALLASLSPKLRSEIRQHECRRLVVESPLFRNAPSQLIDRIVARLKNDVFLPNDVVVRAGGFGDCMFFLMSGTVAVMSRAGDELLHLKDGSFFGEMALLASDERRVSSVVAVEVCEVFRLDKDDFHQTIRPFKQMYQQVQSMAERRLVQTLTVETYYKQLHGTSSSSASVFAQRRSSKPFFGFRAHDDDD